jgi:hypothetical protein
MYRCQGPGPGALLYLPHDGHRKDVIRTKVFEDYIRDNVVSWFEWSKKIGLGIECMESLILVTGCTLVNSWAAAVFFDQDSEISLAVQTVPNGGESFKWRRIRGNVPYRNSRTTQSVSLAVFARHALIFCCTKRLVHPRHWTNASSSGASEQSDACSGPCPSGLKQNRFLTTLTTLARTIFK